MFLTSPRFKARFRKYAGPGCYERFLVHCEDYIEAVSREAEYREQGHVLDMESFESLRRENSAIRLCFGLFEFVLGFDLPNEVFQDPAFMRLYWAAADMVCWSNVSFFLPPLRADSRLIIVSIRRMPIPITWNKRKATVGITS